MTEPAPIVLFTYNRPEHTRKTIDALKNNELAEDSVLYIFSDGPKNENAVSGVNNVRSIIDNVSGFKNIVITKREKNIGLANSIISGVSGVINKHGKVIVLEDDIVTSPYFLKYMNLLLEQYKNVERVFSITGYNYDINIPGNYKYDIYSGYRACSWSWGTWADVWNKTDWNAGAFELLKRSKQKKALFNRSGDDMYHMLYKQMHGLLDSWAIRWALHHCLPKEGYCIYPVNSLVENIGVDGSGTHHKSKSDKYKTLVDLNKNQWKLIEKNFSPNPAIMNAFRKVFKASLLKKVYREIKYFLKEYNKQRFRNTVNNKVNNVLQAVSFPAYLFNDALVSRSHSEDNDSKTLLIIKLERIGDYLLFRNFIEFIARSEKYAGYKITLLGNEEFKSLCEYLDSDFIDNFIWINRKNFLRNFSYRRDKLKEIASQSFTETIAASFSRTAFLEDFIVGKIKSEIKYGCETDNSNGSRFIINHGKKYYSEILNTDSGSFYFEHSKYHFLVKLLTGKMPGEYIPKVKNSVTPYITKTNMDKSKYALFYIGGRSEYKKWNLENFISAAEHLQKEFGLKIMLTGSPAEKDLNDLFISKFTGDAENLAGKTSLIDLIEVIGNAEILISNDSSPVHFAGSLGTKCTAIGNGSHFPRFIPYPKSEKPVVKTLLPKEFMNLFEYLENNDYAGMEPGLFRRSYSDINSISAEEVISAADNLLRE